MAGNLSVGLRPFACWDWGFKCNRGDGCLSVVSVVCCQVAVSASGHSSRGDLLNMLCLSDIYKLR